MSALTQSGPRTAADLPTARQRPGGHSPVAAGLRLSLCSPQHHDLCPGDLRHLRPGDGSPHTLHLSGGHPGPRLLGQKGLWGLSCSRPARLCVHTRAPRQAAAWSETPGPFAIVRSCAWWVLAESQDPGEDTHGVFCPQRPPPPPHRQPGPAWGLQKVPGQLGTIGRVGRGRLITGSLCGPTPPLPGPPSP